MRKFFLTLLMVGMAGICRAEFQIPNLEYSILYDFESHSIVNGMTSKLLGYKDVDFRIGYMENKKPVVCLSYDLKNLEKLGVGIKYFWSGAWNLTIGTGASYNFDSGNLSVALMSVLIQVNFN